MAEDKNLGLSKTELKKLKKRSPFKWTGTGKPMRRIF